MLACLEVISCNLPKQASNNDGKAPTVPNKKNTTYPETDNITHFGALIVPPNLEGKNIMEFKEEVARELNIQYLRDNINLDAPKAHTLP